MAVATADIQAHVAELSDGAFEAFCEDISGMFGAEVTCERQDLGTGAAKDLRRHFKKLTAVHHVEATGTLNGTYHLLFDQGGLFVLSGVIVMLPERRIREEVKRGSIDDAENLTDAAREVGNLLIGSWDRVFREDCEGHDHFLKTGTFIGKPWEDLSKVGLTEDEELISVLYEMTVEPYPSFRCAAVFPKAMMGPSAEPSVAPEPDKVPESSEAKGVEQIPPAPPQEAVAEKPALVAEDPPKATPPVKDEALVSDPVEAEPAQAVEQSDPLKTETVSESTEESVAEEATDPVAAVQIPPDIQSVVQTVVGEATEAAPEVKEEVVEARPAPAAEPVATPPVAAPVSTATFMDQILADHVSYPSDTAVTDLLRTPAKEIMVTEVVWSAPEDTVQDVIAKMQQNNTGYVLIGGDGVLEGLISNSNIMSAISPYLRPMFAKWRRSEDDATLGIKIKWVMSRPVRTVTPEATLGSMIESMRRYGGRCLPVVDNQAKVRGIITVFDILLRVLEAEKAFSWEGRPPQAPPLLI